MRLVTVKFKIMKITLRNKKPLIDIDSFNKKADVIFKDVVIPQIKKYKTMKNYDLKPCKSCGDITCSGQCNWLRPLTWGLIIFGGVLTGWLLKSLIYCFIN